MDERRTWNTPAREPWNTKIHSLLNTIDLHTRLHLQASNSVDAEFHARMAESLRSYVSDLKTWIHAQECSPNRLEALKHDTHA